MTQFIILTEQYANIPKNTVGMVLSKSPDLYSVNFWTGEIVENIPSNIVITIDISKTGDGFKFKICNVCGRYLPVENFQKNQNGKNNRTIRRPSCNDCRKIINGKGIPTKLKKEWEKKKPNLVIWSCPICKKTTIPGLTSKVVLDHNHDTGIPRGWLCDSCNTGLGRFQDNIAVLNNAIEYLKNNN